MKQVETTPWSGPLIVGDADRPLTAFLTDERDWVERSLIEHGSILFRGFGVDSPESFSAVSQAACGELLEYLYRSTPRTSIEPSIYTATEYRADARIELHNENAFQQDWPMRLLFGCLQAPSSGGETLLARTRDVTAAIDESVIERFNRTGVMYVRNYGLGVDLSWETTFQTSVREEVEAFCRREAIRWEWLPDDHLRTKQVCQATACHPQTKEALWFNQAHLFHVSSLGPDDEAVLRSLFTEADLPRNAFFGDGSEIPREMLEHIRGAYRSAVRPLSWQNGDVLLVDNMLVAHGRNPFVGTRRLLVAMGDRFSDSWGSQSDREA